jgi:serine/threonine protein kinase
MSSVDLLPTGCRLGAYEIVDHIATGGMGAVYRAHEIGTGQVVALKILLPDLAKRPALLERFRREAKTTSRLNHRNIVGIHDYAEDNGTHFLIMEYIEGFDLDDLIRTRGRLSPEEAIGILMQAVRGLDHAFRLGIVHRDIKPSNFLLAKTDKGLVVKLLDFGLARAEREEDFRVTQAGSTVGTIDYLSPEQARDSGSADIRSDIYSLGCTFYHMLAGQAPFPEGGIGERVFQHMNVEPQDVRFFNSAITEDTWTVLRRMMEKKPADRYQTPNDLLQDLNKLRKGEPLKPGVAVSAAGIGLAPPRSQAETPRPSPPRRPASDPGSKTPTSEPLKQRRVVDDDPAVLQLSAQDRKLAAAKFEAAKNDVGRNRLVEARRTLLECCRYDPTVLAYRRLLRKLDPPAGGFVTVLKAHVRFLFAKFTGNDRLLLEAGEELLAAGVDQPHWHTDMAEAADRLGLRQTALWIAEKGQLDHSDHVPLVKAFARMLEKAGHLEQALVMWRVVERHAPEDLDVPRKLTQLTASISIHRGHYTDSAQDDVDSA